MRCNANFPRPGSLALRNRFLTKPVPHLIMHFARTIARYYCQDASQLHVPDKLLKDACINDIRDAHKTN
jgi:hypothetical protein